MTELLHYDALLAGSVAGPQGPEGPAGGPGEVDPDPDTDARRGAAGELKATSLELTPGSTLPDQSGQIYIAADGRVWAWSPYSGTASPLVTELEQPTFFSSRFEGGSTTMAERSLTPALDVPPGERAVVIGQLIPEGSLTANLTSYARVRIHRRSSSTGGSQVQLAEIVTTPLANEGTGNWTAFKQIVVLIDSLALPDGTHLTWEIVPAGGAPPTVPACTLYVGVVRAAAFPP